MALKLTKKQREQLLKHPSITKVEHTPDYLRIYTTDLYMSSNKRKSKPILVGKFRVVISKGGRLRIYNCSESRSSFAHPHCRQNGRPCLGQHGYYFDYYWRRGDVEAAVEVILLFLQNYDTDSPMVSYRNWINSGSNR